MESEQKYNVFDHTCPAHRALTLLADKWVLLVILALAQYGSMRNGEIKRLLGNISQKMLIQTLRQLEHSGFVTRTVYKEVPPHVEYRLTQLGQTLLEPIFGLREWAEKYVLEIELAQGQSGKAAV